MIKNYTSLANTKIKKQALQILEVGLTSAQPKNFLKKFVNNDSIILGKNRIILSKYEKIFVVAYGKAADSMTEYVSKKMNISKGIIVIPKHTKHSLTDKKFRIFYSGHPLPDIESGKAGKAGKEFVNNCTKNDFILFLVSGGGSSLLALPDKITLAEKKQTTKLLLKCGATIDEFNCVRKHLSLIKGGRLVQGLNSDGCALILSDVVSNDLSVISSGCTYYDNTTFSDAIDVITKYSLEKKLPKKVMLHLKHGLAAKIIRRKKSRITNKIIATNRDCLDAMILKSKSFGFTTKIHPPVKDDVSVSAKKIVRMIPKRKNSCIIFGGEPTVQVSGNGKGGRNLELVMHIMKLTHNSNDNLIISSITTDGIDGNTTCSGVLAENNLSNIKKISHYLKNNDSYSFFKKHRGLIKTGSTHTNLMDVGLIIKY